MYSVLLVDDSVALREALARSLRRRGCRVTTAGSGHEGLELLRTQAVDVVVTDLNMPERGGLWLWHHARVLRPALTGRFVLIASEPLPEPRSLSLFLQTERILLKPLALDALWQEIRNIMAGVVAPERERRSAPQEPGARPPV
jgi:CheY-like chemotaxis protein